MINDVYIRESLRKIRQLCAESIDLQTESIKLFPELFKNINASELPNVEILKLFTQALCNSITTNDINKLFILENCEDDFLQFLRQSMQIEDQTLKTYIRILLLNYVKMFSQIFSFDRTIEFILNYLTLTGLSEESELFQFDKEILKELLSADDSLKKLIDIFCELPYELEVSKLFCDIVKNERGLSELLMEKFSSTITKYYSEKSLPVAREIRFLMNLFHSLLSETEASTTNIDRVKLSKMVIDCLSEFSEVLVADKVDSCENVPKDIKESIGGLRTALMKVLTATSYQDSGVQSLFNDEYRMGLLLNCVTIDELNPYLREWTVVALRNISENNPENQVLIGKLQSKKRTN